MKSKCKNFSKRSLTWMLVIMLLLTNSQAVLAAQPPFASGGGDGSILVPRAKEATLDDLVSKGLIKPYFLLKRAALAETADHYNDTFSARLQDLIAENNGKGAALFEDEEGLKKIHDLFDDMEPDDIIRTPYDVDAVHFVKTMLAQNSGDKDLADEIALIIEGLKPRETFEINPNPNSSLQGTWTNDNKVILRWLPEGEWIPPNGYNLYRVVGRNAQLLASGIGSQSGLDASLEQYAEKKARTLADLGDPDDEDAQEVDAREVKASFSNLIQQARVTSQDLNILGFNTERDLNRSLYKEENMVRNIQIIRDPVYYEEHKAKALELPQGSTYTEKDLRKEVVLSGKEVLEQIKSAKEDLTLAGPGFLSQFESNVLPVNQFSVPSGLLETLDKERMEEKLSEIKNARTLVKSQANFDFEFAEISGLAYVDDLSGVTHSTDEEISYVLLPLNEGTANHDLKTLGDRVYRYNRERGFVTDPSYTNSPVYFPNQDNDLIVAVPEIGLEVLPAAPHTITGFGVNDSVSLRWNLAENATQRGMISGYNVYRRGGSEQEYSLITETPITPAYVTLTKGDISGTFEGPIFLTDDTAKDGETYSYRIASVDVFGRSSSLSDTSFEITVIKTNLPLAPTVETPYLSHLVDETNSSLWLQQAVKGIRKPSAIVPMSAVSSEGRNSGDTVLFRIYRSEAYGKNSYSTPELIASVEAIDKVAREIAIIGSSSGKDIPGLGLAQEPEDTRLIENKLKTERIPGLYYLDENVDSGYSYQYWVVAVDAWDNESPWSLPVSLAYESGTAPSAVGDTVANFVGNIRPRTLDCIPGFGDDRIVSNERNERISQLMAGEVESVLEHSSPGATYLAPEQSPGLGSLQATGSYLNPDLGQTLGTLQVSAHALTAGNLELSHENLKVRDAIRDGSDFGRSLTVSSVLEKAALPQTLTAEYGNLPELAQILHVLAFRTEDIDGNGNLELAWPPYQGHNLRSYAIYRGLAKNSTLESLKELDKAAVLETIKEFTLVVGDEEDLTEDTYTDGPLALHRNDLYVYLVAAIPEAAEKIAGYSEMKDTDTDNAYGGWVKVLWTRSPDEALVNYYRVYRAEVGSLASLRVKDYEGLSYELLEDHVPYTYCIDSVEQSTSHSYVYKIIPVSLWGVEGAPKYSTVRVPTTVPPAEPEMLLPYSQPGAVEVRFTPVVGATQYHIYRADIPVLKKANLYDKLAFKPILSEQMQAVVGTVSQDYTLYNKYDKEIVSLALQGNISDFFDLTVALPGESQPEPELDISMELGDDLFFYDDYREQPVSSVQGGSSKIVETRPNVAQIADTVQLGIGAGQDYNREALLKFSTPVNPLTILDGLKMMNTSQKNDLVMEIIEEYGVLAVARYSQLNAALASTVEWKEIGIKKVDGQPAEDALSFTDKTAVHGEKYLYTVAAANEDLMSTRPEPIEAEAQKGEPFPEAEVVQHTYGYITLEDGKTVWANNIRWNHITSPYFTQAELLRDWIVGYVVFRSAYESGPYYQVSGLVSGTRFTDATASPLQQYHYRVKTVDTAGFVTDFDDKGAASGAQQDSVQYFEPSPLANPLHMLDLFKQGGIDSLLRPPTGSSSLAEEPGSFGDAVDGLTWNGIGGVPEELPWGGVGGVLEGLSWGFDGSLTPPSELLSSLIAQQTELLGQKPNLLALPGYEDATIKGITGIIDHLTPLDDIRPYSDFVAMLKDLSRSGTRSLIVQGYEIVDVSFLELALNPYTGNDELPIALYGRGNVKLGKSGIMLPVNFVITNMLYYGSSRIFPYEILDAQIELLLSPYIEPDTGVRLDSIDLLITSKTVIVSDGLPGHSRWETFVTVGSRVMGTYTFGGNFLGDLTILPISSGEITSDGKIIIKKVPVFNWGDFRFYGLEKMTLDLDALNKSYAPQPDASANQVFPVTLHNGRAINSLTYSTLDNSGLEFTFTTLGYIPGDLALVLCPQQREIQKQAILGNAALADVNVSGALYGLYGVMTVVPDSYVQLVTPAGLSVRATSGKVVFGGRQMLNSKSTLSGTVVLPFFEAPPDLADGIPAPRLTEAREADVNALILSLYGGGPGVSNIVLDTTILSIFDQVIGGGLLVLDGRTYGLATVPFSMTQWDGSGFVLNHEVLEPVLVGNYDLNRAVSATGSQDSGQTNPYSVTELNKLLIQSFVLRSPDIGVDLSKKQRLPGLDKDKWYNNLDWMGIALNSGSISLSRAIVVAKDDSLGGDSAAITFALEPREMLYDRTGFFYYNKLEPEGEPMSIAFDEEFGGFEDATLSYCEVSMYANKFDLTIAGSVSVPLFGNQSVDYRMYTDKENGAVHAFMLPQKLILGTSHALGNSHETVSLYVSNGYFDAMGVHIDGVLSLRFPGELSVDAEFFELVIPSDPWEITTKRQELFSGESIKKGAALLAKPIATAFNGYSVELRAFDLYAQYGSQETVESDFSLGIYFSGSASLTGNSEMPDHNNARFFVADILDNPHIDLKECVIHITLPLGSEGVMSGTVTPSGKEERKLTSRSLGEDSATYALVKEAQERNKQALETVGKVEDLCQKIDDAIAEANRILRDTEGYGAELETDLKNAMRNAVRNFRNERQAVHSLIVGSARQTVDSANAYIAKANRQIDTVNAFIDKYAELSPADKERYKDGMLPHVDRIDKEPLIDKVEAFSASIFEAESLNKTEAALLAEIDALRLNIFSGQDFSAYVIPFDSSVLHITEVIEPVAAVLAEAQERLDQVVDCYDEANGYINQLDKYFDGEAYPGFTIGENGIVEFNPKDDAFCMALMKYTDLFEGTNVQIEGRVGWKANTGTSSGGEEIAPDLFFYAFALAYIPDEAEAEGKGTGIKLGAMELQNVVGISAYNFNLPFVHGQGYVLATGTDMLASIATLEIDLTNRGNSFLAVSADMYVNSSVEKHLFAIKDMMLIVESTGSFQVSGDMFGPDEITGLAKAGPNNSTTLYGFARLTYNANLKTFEFRAGLHDLKVFPGFRIGGTVGMDWGPEHWMLYLGWPETLDITYVPWGLTGGFGLQVGVNPYTGGPVLKVALKMEYSDEFTILIVYAKVSARVMVTLGYGPWNMMEGEEAFRWFNKGNAFEGFAAGGELGGEVRGGIKILKKRFEIIRIALDAHLGVVNPREDYTYLQDAYGNYYVQRTVNDRGEPVSDKGIWHLDAFLRISFHLDLWLVTYEDSFDFHYATKFNMS